MGFYRLTSFDYEEIDMNIDPDDDSNFLDDRY